MLYEGLSRRHALRLIEIVDSRQTTEALLSEYFTKNKASLQNSLFKDAYFGFKFWSLLTDNIKRTHTTLAYILRKQYRNVDAVYEHLRDYINKESTPSIQGLQKHVALGDPNVYSNYYEDVNKYIILPVMKRFSLYSPFMSFVIFMDILCVMVDSYIEKGWSAKSKDFMSQLTSLLNVDWMVDTETSIYWLTQAELEMMADEISVFKQLRQRHQIKQRGH